MKKIILSAAVIAVTFGFLAFSPVEQNNVIDNELTSAFEILSGRCDTKYEQDVKFTKCNKTWTEDPIGYAFQKNVLDQL